MGMLNSTLYSIILLSDASFTHRSKCKTALGAAKRLIFLFCFQNTFSLMKKKKKSSFSLTLHSAQLLEARNGGIYGVGRWFVHELEGRDVDAYGQQLESDTGEGAPLYLGHRHLLQLLELLERVGAVALAGRLAAGSSGSLPGLRLRHLLHAQNVQARGRVVHALLHDARVYHAADSCLTCDVFLRDLLVRLSHFYVDTVSE